MPEKIKLKPFVKKITPIDSSATMLSVFEQFWRNQEMTFFPVVDSTYKPLGLIREYDLKPYAYAMFGRELIRHESLDKFISSCPVIPIETKAEDVLPIAAAMKVCDGIIVTDASGYYGMLSSQSILSIFEENRKASLRRLAQANKMEAIGTLAGGIAHDFNNILMPIMGYAEMIQLFGGQRDPGPYLEQILIAGRRAKDLINQILAFSRQKDSEKIALNIDSVVKEVSKLLRSTLPSTIKIETSIDKNLDRIFADPTEIHQIVMNLCANAAHAMKKDGGILSMELRHYTGPVIGWCAETIPPPDPCVLLVIRDTGHGIPESVLEKIFDPFFTTKKQGEGTGMGLSVVHGIVKRSRGVISVETSTKLKDSGTSFFLYFPLYKDSSKRVLCQSSKLVGSAKISLAKSAKALCIDDEYMNVEMVKETLELVGFTVSKSTNSIDALATFQNSPDDYDLVVTDQTMPGLTGIELAKKMLKIRPDVPIILMTGYSETVSADLAKACGVRSFMMKPVDLEFLAQTAVKLVENSAEE